MSGRLVFVIAFALVLYGNGAAFIESFVNYPSWALIDARTFTEYHRFIAPRVIAFLVVPALLGTVFTVVLLWIRPPGIPPWTIWGALIMQGIVWGSTAMIQVPIQLSLSEHGLSLELLERLVSTNFWLRRIPYALTAGLYMYMAMRALGIEMTGRTR